MQLIFQMQQLANDQEYLIICNHSEEINKLVADIARQNYTAPREVEKPRDFDPFGQTGLPPLATI